MNYMTFWQYLSCPACRAKLIKEDGTLKCPRCKSDYPVKNGVPILLLPSAREQIDSILSQKDGESMAQEYNRRASFFLRLLRPPDIHFNAGLNLSGSEGDMLYEPGKLVLNLGGGPHRYRSNEITLNIGLFPNVDIVGDAHNIPFSDGILDTVICNAVLEHVSDPAIVVKEIYRVLKPKGQIYIEVPFFWFYHGYPCDFWRFTISGVRKLFSGFEEIQVGITQGPTGAFLQFFVSYIIFLLNAWDKIWIRKTLSFLLRWPLFPFKFLDKRLNKRPDAHVMAGGFYFWGSKGKTQDG